uniref:Methyltransferase domain-containing protein n=1 Tax=Ciona savignyi TaxID=51511 RepID=H2ZEG7_CIOSA
MHNITSIGRSCSIMQCLKSAIFKENPVKNERFLLTGLHACGDLSATMVKLFAECHEVTAVVSVACCYMKITTDLDQPQMGRMNNQEDSYRYPLSEFVQKLPDHCLPYKSREASCHALEDYKLRLEENTNHLKMHCYRAVLESMIRESYPEIIRPPVQTVKKAYDLPFLEYVKLAFVKLNLELPNEISDSSRFESMLSRWQQVVTYYTISVMVASVVEMIILLDRMLFLEENNFECELSATFEPTLSPRCFSITAHK